MKRRTQQLIILYGAALVLTTLLKFQLRPRYGHPAIQRLHPQESPEGRGSIGG